MTGRTDVPFVLPIRPRNLLWVPILAGVIAAGSIFGTPHLRFQYIWNGDERHPVYFECGYWGLHNFRVEPSNGQCPVMMLAHGPQGISR